MEEKKNLVLVKDVAGNKVGCWDDSLSRRAKSRRKGK